MAWLEPSPSGTGVSPMAARWATNHSNSSSGSRRSTTADIGIPSSASQAPPHSQLPTCGSAMTMPRPSAKAARRWSSPSSSLKRARTPASLT